MFAPQKTAPKTRKKNQAFLVTNPAASIKLFHKSVIMVETIPANPSKTRAKPFNNPTTEFPVCSISTPSADPIASAETEIPSLIISRRVDKKLPITSTKETKKDSANDLMPSESCSIATFIAPPESFNAWITSTRRHAVAVRIKRERRFVIAVTAEKTKFRRTRTIFSWV